MVPSLVITFILSHPPTKKSILCGHYYLLSPLLTHSCSTSNLDYSVFLRNTRLLGLNSLLLHMKPPCFIKSQWHSETQTSISTLKLRLTVWGLMTSRTGFWPGRGGGGEVAVVFSAPLDLLMGSSPAETSIASVRYLHYRKKETNEKVASCHTMSHHVTPCQTKSRHSRTPLFQDDTADIMSDLRYTTSSILLNNDWLH